MLDTLNKIDNKKFQNPSDLMFEAKGPFYKKPVFSFEKTGFLVGSVSIVEIIPTRQLRQGSVILPDNVAPAIL